MVNPTRVPWSAGEILYERCVDSTNEAAKRGGQAGTVQGTVYQTDRQSAGKGRRGRSWYSEDENNLYFTILLRPILSPEKTSMLTLVMAYAVTQVIRQYTGLDARIKWPNDIVVSNKKVCGILSEMKLSGTSVQYCVIGVGINVEQKQFAEDIVDKATSLALEGARDIDRDMLLQKILDYFWQEYLCFEKAEDLSRILESYNTLLINLDRQVRVLDPKGEFEGIARGITKTGELLVELSDGQVEKIYAGEVSVRGLYGYV